ncbi:hypothetical protein M413DRAFT_448104 [Hebeloma cylindrosporum]|uniref:Uncharacterized protein n=1 Tax=Hebeloma cylindrosporum TaxID=76867 RepID=A0A0C3BN38_HEBCY|nr:hypothetical protein M413DRAFT_448104 [Hebeloma cylindrosporum h7]
MVKFAAILPAVALLVASFSGVAADLKVTSPSSSIWWVAKSLNEIAWTCKDTTIDQFTVLVNNADPKILVAPIAVIAIQKNYDCSITITQDQANQPVGTGWTVLLANPLNNTDVYATSEPFEIKPLGCAYPSQSTPTSANSSGSGSASTSKPTSAAVGMGAGFGGAFAGALAAAAALWA